MGLIAKLFDMPSIKALAKLQEAEHAAKPAGLAAFDMTLWQPPIEWFGTGVYEREAAVRTVIDHIARNIASMPFKVYRRLPDGSREEDHDGDLAKLIARPSRLPGVTRYRFLYSLLVDMLLDDRWLCRLESTPDGGYTLRRIPPRNFSLGGNGLDEITKVQVSAGGPDGTVSYDLPDPRIILDVGFSTSGIEGAPISGTLAPLLAEARAMADYRRSIARHGFQIPAYAYRPKEMEWTQEEKEDFAQGLRNYRRDGGAAGGWPVLDDGMEIRTLDAFKPIDVADLEARDKINVEVANAFHISPENIGFRTGTNSNISAYKEQMWNVELMPYIVAFENALNLDLPESLGEADRYVEANVDAKLRGTLETQYQALSTATGRAFMTTNEARERLNLPSLTEGDKLVTPLNVLVGGQPSPQDGGETQEAQRGAKATQAQN